MPLSITLLVVATFILIVTSLFIFSIRKDNFNNQINAVAYFERFYSDEPAMDFYIKQIVNRVDVSNQQDIFNAFKKELDAYKNNAAGYPLPEFEQLEAQLNKDHITIENNILKINFEINFSRTVSDSADPNANKLFTINYRKKFEYTRDISSNPISTGGSSTPSYSRYVTMEEIDKLNQIVQAKVDIRVDSMYLQYNNGIWVFMPDKGGTGELFESAVKALLVDREVKGKYANILAAEKKGNEWDMKYDYLPPSSGIGSLALVR